MIKKVTNTVSWAYNINDLKGKEIPGTLYEKELLKIYQKEFRIKKIIKRKGDQLYGKCKENNNLFDSWINKKKI